MVFVCGDGATDQIIISNSELDTTHVFDTTVESLDREASANQLRKIMETFSRLPGNESVKLDCSCVPRVQTISKWVKKTINSEARFFFDEYIGLKKLETSEAIKDAGSLRSRMSNCKVAAVYDIYNSSYKCYDALAEFDGWIVVRTLLQKEKKLSVLLKKLLEGNKQKKTIVVLNSTDLRNAGVKISTGISWEQLITEVYSEFSSNQLSDLRKFAYLVVCFEHEGLVIFDNIDNKHTAVFFPNEIEGDYLKSRPKVFGLLVTMQATLVASLCKMESMNGSDNISNILVNASALGIRAMRELIEHGFTDECYYPDEYICKYIDANIDLNDTLEDDERLTIIELDKIKNDMALLEEACTKKVKTIDELSREIVTTGVGEALSGIPVLKYEGFVSADRNEIEDYRKIYNLFEKYLLNNKADSPISICVFGSPGAGKSFGIEEITKHINKNKNFKTQNLTFNLSQFRSEDLPLAFNQIRDVSLKGDLPIVFWDEFDCALDGTRLGWLKKLLGPMQDGDYFENARKHLIGRAIFVFAGGIYKNWQQIKCDEAESIESKLPDFLSRIEGHIDVLGLNQEKCGLKKFLDEAENREDFDFDETYRKSVRTEANNYLKYYQSDEEHETTCSNLFEKQKGSNKTKTVAEVLTMLKQCNRPARCDDQLFIIRRAVVLRNLLEKHLGKSGNESIEFTDNIANLLSKPNYEFGVRSLKQDIRKLFPL